MFGKFVLPVAVLLTALSLNAETVLFRGGEVLAAELSSRKPQVANLPAEETAQATVYALVTVKLQPGRTISTEDYSLSALGGTYRCLAIRENNGAFDAAKWHWAGASPQKKYGMLFALQLPAGLQRARQMDAHRPRLHRPGQRRLHRRGEHSGQGHVSRAAETVTAKHFARSTGCGQYYGRHGRSGRYGQRHRTPPSRNHEPVSTVSTKSTKSTSIVPGIGPAPCASRRGRRRQMPPLASASISDRFV